MNRFNFRRVMQSLALVYIVTAAAEIGAQGLESSRPNIILVMTDDQGYSPIGRHGHPWLKTPHLDALYDSSTRFTRFLVSPTCSPTRAAIMTGRHPMKNGVTHTILEAERMTLDAVTLPQVLKQSGYQTGIFGKWHLGDEAPYQPERRGFDEVFIHGGGGIGQAYKTCSCADAPNNEYQDPVIRHNGKFVKTRGFCTDVFFTAALGWIKERKDRSNQPFFAYVATNAPHGPYIAPEKNARRFKERGFSDGHAGFYGMVENIDENVGRLLAKLETWGLARNTLVIFMSDNGMPGSGGGRWEGEAVPLGKDEHGADMLPFAAGMKGGKGSVDEGGVRVPFFVRWTGRIQPGRDIDRIAAHLDILPTLAALADAGIPKHQVDGRNLLPLLEDPRLAARWPDRFLFNHRGRWNPGENPDDFQWRNFSVRNQRFRLVGAALFDLHADPGQAEDVSAAHPTIVQAMRAAYAQFWKEARPLMVNASVPMSPVQPYHVWYAEQMQAGGIPEWKAPKL